MKFNGQIFYWWGHGNWPIGQWVIFHATLDTAICQSFFSPHEFIIWFKSIKVKQVDLETSLVIWSLCNLMHWRSLCSLLRTYERLTMWNETSAGVKKWKAYTWHQLTKINGLPVSSHSCPKLRNHASTTTKRHHKQPNIHKQILQTDLHTFPYRMSYENFIKDQSIFPLVIILLILISYTLYYHWRD